MKIEEVEYASYLSYVPRYRAKTPDQKASSVLTYKLKSNEFMPEFGMYAAAHIAQSLKENVSGTPIARFFKDMPTLVPVPGSHKTDSASLWVPRILAEEMAKCGLGSKPIACLRRSKAVQKSSISPGNRPHPAEHYESFSVETCVDIDDVLLVDDVITLGSTVMGAANIIRDRFPEARIRGFAAVNTVYTEKFRHVVDPKAGLIRLDAQGRANKAY